MIPLLAAIIAREIGTNWAKLPKNWVYCLTRKNSSESKLPFWRSLVDMLNIWTLLQSSGNCQSHDRCPSSQQLAIASQCVLWLFKQLGIEYGLVEKASASSLCMISLWQYILTDVETGRF
ncbi:MAG: hypothetical protein V7K32_26405 [Nostoc sp.]|uniref:hypothetical protein n=1 Tax=Nostoc sp. TaxID=1180 RepID=UPI002FF6A708